MAECQYPSFELGLDARCHIDKPLPPKESSFHLKSQDTPHVKSYLGKLLKELLMLHAVCTQIRAATNKEGS